MTMNTDLFCKEQGIFQKTTYSYFLTNNTDKLSTIRSTPDVSITDKLPFELTTRLTPRHHWIFHFRLSSIAFCFFCKDFRSLDLLLLIFFNEFKKIMFSRYKQKCKTHNTRRKKCATRGLYKMPLFQ